MGNCLPIPLFQVQGEWRASPGLLRVPTSVPEVEEGAFVLGRALATSIRRTGVLLTPQEACEVSTQFAVGLQDAIRPPSEDEWDDEWDICDDECDEPWPPPLANAASGDVSRTKLARLATPAARRLSLSAAFTAARG